ncbi:hypothetical protein LEP1GSC047_2454 [Leptospira inadai serovar Lyme str. 10]|uniref:Uncharacterized protein n=2 Tax=Leptospira inadai serovar Lyme TaxID=293084 RepID=V6HEE9_9LEPT|nr:hypothetical protein [Leptospira inadai]EQA38412.1 hypothetical protein LEP1GSC047_2454 [Leptospira inadai serovar Lyme str. 10]PNV75207.1 hypothetical protein BES34_010010 [Leptospira inadai serovar Lyme]
MEETPSLFPKTKRDLILENLDWFGLPVRVGELVENVLDGKIREQSLVCCHSACDVCNSTIRSCVRKVQRELEGLG